MTVRRKEPRAGLKAVADAGTRHAGQAAKDVANTARAAAQIATGSAARAAEVVAQAAASAGPVTAGGMFLLSTLVGGPGATVDQGAPQSAPVDGFSHASVLDANSARTGQGTTPQSFGAGTLGNIYDLATLENPQAPEVPATTSEIVVLAQGGPSAEELQKLNVRLDRLGEQLSSAVDAKDAAALRQLLPQAEQAKTEADQLLRRSPAEAASYGLTQAMKGKGSADWIAQVSGSPEEKRTAAANTQLRATELTDNVAHQLLSLEHPEYREARGALAALEPLSMLSSSVTRAAGDFEKQLSAVHAAELQLAHLKMSPPQYQARDTFKAELDAANEGLRTARDNALSGAKQLDALWAKMLQPEVADVAVKYLPRLAPELTKAQDTPVAKRLELDLQTGNGTDEIARMAEQRRQLVQQLGATSAVLVADAESLTSQHRARLAS